MKVDVIQAHETTFKRFHWWSDWYDIAVFDCDYEGYLLQMKVSRSNSKKFRSRKLSGFKSYKHVMQNQIGDLTQMLKDGE